MAKPTRRQRIQLPHCYYEGYLEKRSFKDKKSRKLWTSLCGNTLFFFNEKRDNEYIEKLDLCGFVSVADDGSVDQNLDAARFNLQLKDVNVKFTAMNAEARELWKGFIQSVVELSVPSSLNLLPGQIHMLRGVVEREKERLKDLPAPPTDKSNPYICLKADMPTCYHNVSRLEAELLLEREAKKGNLVLRPGSDGNFAITTRQDYEGVLFRHYRVTRKHTGGFTIDVESPVFCATLYDVISYLVEKTDGVLIPLFIDDTYARNISFIRSDKENGERSLQQALSITTPPLPPPKPVSPKLPTSKPKEAEKSEVIETLEEKQSEGRDSSAAQPPELEKKPTKKPILPPTPAPRKSVTQEAPALCPTNTGAKKIITPDFQRHMPLAAVSELKLKLEQKVKCLE